MEKTVSVAAARRTLGSLSKKMTDNQVKEMINTLHLLAREQVLYNGSKVNELVNESEHSNSKT